MAVYVDDVFIHAKVGRLDARWCHLMADSDEELIEFAVSIGLKKQWLQEPDRRYGAHFDVTENVRRKAVKAGAIEVEWRKLPELMDYLEYMRANAEY